MELWEPLKILSCGAGMQSTALALMSCENAVRGMVHDGIPVYSAILFCDLGHEAPWVYSQVEFISAACRQCGIPFYILETGLYQTYLRDFGRKRVSNAPFWTLDENGKVGRLRRQCTLDYKIKVMQQFVKRELLGYRPNERIGPYDIGRQEMHLGFSAEEGQRRFESRHPLFVNKYPLIQMGWKRADCYGYTLERWGLETKASACTFCPYHRNCYFEYLKLRHTGTYEELVALDEVLEERQPATMIRNKVYISRSCKRLVDLRREDCMDARHFIYAGRAVWDGF